MQYRVIALAQSTVSPEHNPPVEIRYYTGPDLAVAAAALVSAAVESNTDSRWVRTLSVRMDITPDPTTQEN